MRVVLFASPGLLGPYALMTLLQAKIEVVLLVLPTSQYAVSASEMIGLADHAKIPMVAPLSLQKEEFVKQVEALVPDVILVSTFDKRIPLSLIKIPRWGAYNIHPSLLPRYRGACPEFWAVRNGEKETGITIHELSEEFDAGNIIMQEKIAIHMHDTVGSLLYHMVPVVSSMITKLMQQIEREGRLQGLPQDQKAITQAPLVMDADLRIDWTQPAEQIYNLIRAANPVGGAWTMFRGFQMKVWHGEPYDGVVNGGDGFSPGMMLRQSKDKQLLVRTGAGYLSIRVLQPALYYILDGWGFSERTTIEQGEVLGLSEQGGK